MTVDSVGTFSFLKKDFDAPVLDAVVVRSLAANSELSSEDATILEDILSSVERNGIPPYGLVSPCDADYKTALSVGNVANSTVGEVWHGARLSEIRKQHLNNHRSACYPCDRCGISY